MIWITKAQEWRENYQILFLYYDYDFFYPQKDWILLIQDSFLSFKDDIYKNVLPPLKVLSEADKKEMLSSLNKLDFNIKNLKAA